MNKTPALRFHDQLPFRIVLLGREIQFEQTASGEVMVKPSNHISVGVFLKTAKRWDHRKGITIDGPEQRAHYRWLLEQFRSDPVPLGFLQFLVKQPIGLRPLIFDTKKRFESMKARRHAIDEACLTWLAANYGERTNGRMKYSVPCAGYLAKIPKYLVQKDRLSYYSNPMMMCNKNVSELSGMCPVHGKPDARTLFNFYPFFEAEGFPELMDG